MRVACAAMLTRHNLIGYLIPASETEFGFPNSFRRPTDRQASVFEVRLCTARRIKGVGRMRARNPKTIRKLLVPFSVGVFGVLLTLVLGLIFGIPNDGLTRDVFAIVGVIPIAGILSNFGACIPSFGKSFSPYCLTSWSNSSLVGC